MFTPRYHLAMLRHLHSALVAAPAAAASSSTPATPRVRPVLHWTTQTPVLQSWLSSSGSAGNSSESDDVALDGKTYAPYPLLEKIPLTHNTAVYRFALPTPTSTLGLPIGQHMFLSTVVDGKKVTRQYTPVSSDADKGYFDLLIKVYPGGKMSGYVDSLAPGETVDVKGPKGRFKYERGMVDSFGMIAGGTGITPMLQIITAVLEDPLDTTKLSLIFANVNEDDILLKDDLDALAASYPDQFDVHYVLNNPPDGWTGGVGFVTGDMISRWLPPASHATRLLLCGPKPMIKAMKSIAQDLDFDVKGGQVFSF